KDYVGQAGRRHAEAHHRVGRLDRRTADVRVHSGVVKTLVAAIVLATAAWLVGESADEVGPIAELVVIFIVPIVIALAAFAVMRRRNIAIAILLGFVTFGAAYGGRQCFTRAYNGCVGNADDIKGILEKYRRGQ